PRLRGGQRLRRSRQQGGADRDEDCYGISPHRCAAGADSEAGAGEKDPRSRTYTSGRRSSWGGHPGGQGQQRPPDQARSDVRRRV
ncbi:MAG: hypothetical protein ACK56F_26350, partial [bacterium]